MRNCECHFLIYWKLTHRKFSGNFSILLLLYGYVQCLTTLENPTAETGIFMEDLCHAMQNHKKLVNPFDKHGYFECINGESIEKNCPGKKTFNPTLQRCMSDTKPSLTSKLTTKDKVKKRQPSVLAAKYHLLPKSLSLAPSKTVTKKPKRFIRGLCFVCVCNKPKKNYDHL